MKKFQQSKYDANKPTTENKVQLTTLNLIICIHYWSWFIPHLSSILLIFRHFITLYAYAKSEILASFFLINCHNNTTYITPFHQMTITTYQLVPNRATTLEPMSSPAWSQRSVSEPEPDPDPESFSDFFENWLLEQDRDLQELTSAARSQTETESTWSLRQLVTRVMGHYENYYRVKSESVKDNVLSMLTPAWRSHLEDAFLWIGGWRPSMAFHLLYSISGLQLEAGLSDMLRGLSTGDLGDLTPSQLGRVDELQRLTLREEKQLTETLAAHQETVADSSMVELSHLATELIRDPDSSVDTESVSDRVVSTLASKEDKLEEILKKADDLRLRTLKDVVDILNPIQAVYFLIAAAELHLRVHEWGKKKDVANGFSGPGSAHGPTSGSH